MTKNWMGTGYHEVWVWPSGLDYGVVQRERCPTTLRLHWQFLLCFKTRKRFSSVCRLMPGSHVEAVRDLVLAREYCMKAATRVEPPQETGQWVAPVVLTSVITALKHQRPLSLISDHPNLWRHFRTMQSIRQAVVPCRKMKTSTLLLCGETGKGKTAIALLIASFLPEDDVFWHDGSVWFDGYDGQPLIISDEFRGLVPVNTLLTLADRTPCRVPFKGGYAQFNSVMLILTSNLRLDQIYNTDHLTKAALRRKICEYVVY